jgi:hypothetical protein
MKKLRLKKQKLNHGFLEKVPFLAKTQAVMLSRTRPEMNEIDTKLQQNLAITTVLINISQFIQSLTKI